MLRETKTKIRDLRNQSAKAENLDEQTKIQSEIRDTEKKQRKLRQQIFDIEDQVLEKRDKLIEDIKKCLKQENSAQPIFTARFRIV